MTATIRVAIVQAEAGVAVDPKTNTVYVTTGAVGSLAVLAGCPK